MSARLRDWSEVRGWAGWAALAVSVAAYATVAVAMHQPFHESIRAPQYVDLRIYRGAAQRVVHATSLYGAPIHDGLGFTYPPFAALLLLPLTFVSISLDELAVTALNMVLLVWIMRRTLLIATDRGVGPGRAAPGRAAPPGRAVVGRAQAWSLAALAAAAAVWLEPVSATLGFGQINLLIAALVVLDLSRPDTARTKGAAIGLAAAIKLTPLMFLPYLLLSGRRRAAALGTSAFVASIALAYALLGHDAARYWGGLFLHSSRVGNVVDTANQSLWGAAARLGAGAGAGVHPGIGSELAIGAIVLTGLGLAVRAARRGDEAAGFSLAALSTLLASPISWTHHWTLAVPALLLLGRQARRRRSWSLAAATAALACLGYAYLPERIARRPLHPGLETVLTRDPYALAATLVLAATAATAAALAAARSPTTHRARSGDLRLPADRDAADVPTPG